MYVSTGHGNSVMFVDALTMQVVGTVAVGKRPWGIAMTSDGRVLVTANGLSKDASVIDVAARKVVATIPTGDGAWGVAIPRQ